MSDQPRTNRPTKCGDCGQPIVIMHAEGVRVTPPHLASIAAQAATPDVAGLPAPPDDVRPQARLPWDGTLPGSPRPDDGPSGHYVHPSSRELKDREREGGAPAKPTPRAALEDPK